MFSAGPLRRYSGTRTRPRPTVACTVSTSLPTRRTPLRMVVSVVATITPRTAITLSACATMLTPPAVAKCPELRKICVTVSYANYESNFFRYSSCDRCDQEIICSLHSCERVWSCSKCPTPQKRADETRKGSHLATVGGIRNSFLSLPIPYSPRTAGPPDGRN